MSRAIICKGRKRDHTQLIEFDKEEWGVVWDGDPGFVAGVLFDKIVVGIRVKLCK